MDHPFSLPISPCAPFLGTHLSLRSPFALYEDDWGRVRRKTCSLPCLTASFVTVTETNIIDFQQSLLPAYVAEVES